MLGLFAVLNLGARSLATQRAGVEVAGHNLANVNNPAYARQRVEIETSPSFQSAFGPQGTGADAVAVRQIRSLFVDQQITGELSVGSSFEAQQGALEYAQASLGEVLGASGSVSPGLAASLQSLFTAFQSVATSPSSLTERQLLLGKAQDFASQLNQTSQRLSSLNGSLNETLGTDVTDANQLLAEIADLNDRVLNMEGPAGGVANDLRDLRQSKLEELSKLVKVDANEAPNGALNLSVNGTALVTDKNVLDTFQTYDAGGGQLLVRSAIGGTPLALSGGQMNGIIESRDGALTDLRGQLDTLAGSVIARVNAVHSGGFGLSGSTGAAFFTGTSAATIAVNAALVSDPSLVQISGAAGSPGDNQVGLALARLAEERQPGLNSQTFSQSYSGTVAQLGQSLASVNSQVDDQQVVQTSLLQQRESVSGVSIDEEMSDLIKYQKAFEASAKLITVVDDMLNTLISMKA